MKNIDCIKWDVKNALYWFQPHTCVTVDTLSIKSDKLIQLHGARNFKLWCNACFYETIDRIPGSEKQISENTLFIPTNNVDFFIVDTTSGFFERYQDFSVFNIKKFMAARDKYMRAGSRGMFVMPANQGDAAARNILNFAEKQNGTLFKKEILQHINNNIKVR